MSDALLKMAREWMAKRYPLQPEQHDALAPTLASFAEKVVRRCAEIADDMTDDSAVGNAIRRVAEATKETTCQSNPTSR